MKQQSIAWVSPSNKDKTSDFLFLLFYLLRNSSLCLQYSLVSHGRNQQVFQEYEPNDDCIFMVITVSHLSSMP